ncbi:Myb-like DNA-binding domain protein [Haplosporangium bisporale]|nr:Myb-like DNA-binding domain protein [Haplosporangium bisporale]
MDNTLFDGRQRGVPWKQLSTRLNRPVGACYTRYFRVLDPFLADAVEDDEYADDEDGSVEATVPKAFPRGAKEGKGVHYADQGPWTARDRETLEQLIVAKAPWTTITHELHRNLASCKEKWHRIQYARLEQRRHSSKIQSAQRKRLFKEGFRPHDRNQLVRAVERYLGKKRTHHLPSADSSSLGFMEMGPTAFPALQSPASSEAIDWDAIAVALNNKFPAQRLQSIYYELAAAKLIWTPEEDDRLIRAVIRLGPPELQPNIWTLIKDAFGDVYRANDDYRKRWRILDMPPLEREWDNLEKKKFWRRYMEYQRQGSLFSLPAFQPAQGLPGPTPQIDHEAPRTAAAGTEGPVHDDTMWDKIAEGLEYRHGRDCELYFNKVTVGFPKDPGLFNYLTKEIANVYLNPRRANWTAEASRLLVATVNSFKQSNHTVRWKSVAKALGDEYTAQQCESRWYYWEQRGSDKESQDVLLEATLEEEGLKEEVASTSSHSTNNTDPLPKHSPQLWTDKELELLIQGVDSYGRNWIKIRDTFLPHRTTQMLQERFWRTQHKKSGRFSVKERSLLETAIETYGEDASWELIASQVPGRSASQCRQNWKYSHTHHVQKLDEPWTDRDRERLKNAVDKFGKNQWVLVSEFVVGKTPVECRHQWREKLASAINQARWTDQERGLLMDRVVSIVEAAGEKVLRRSPSNSTLSEFVDPEPRYKGKRRVDWKEVAKGMPGRTAEQCRLQFNVHRHLYLIQGDI